MPLGPESARLVAASVSVIVVTLLAAFPQEAGSAEAVRWWYYLIGAPIGITMLGFHLAMIIECIKRQRGLARVMWLLPMLVLPVAPAVIYFMVTRHGRGVPAS